MKRQEILLFLLVRQIEAIDKNFWQKAAADIGLKKKNDDVVILKFIDDMATKYKHCNCCETKNYPCILIVDDVSFFLPRHKQQN